ncbi:Alkylphosphocholine resistance protein LEM3 [Candida viswanathii]|uniref:Alkylphosphocholine resistance protein LEM3 n=1 Tax=Candida viswanathii TaxID=5486 RepID=A0A367YMZ0_9ASCO|nr:Alkylphosphocholine resistance protein LEM3 [Candida viswanathii]
MAYTEEQHLQQRRSGNGGVEEFAQEDGYESSSSTESEIDTAQEKSRRPKENAFTQQRLKAINPVLTAKTVIPLLVAIAIIFVPLGAAMWYASDRIEDITIEYSQCENEATYAAWTYIPEKYVDYNFRQNYGEIIQPSFAWRLTNDPSQPFEDERTVCQVQFQLFHPMKGPIYLYYRLHNFYANHRRFVKSFSEDQLNGKPASLDTIKNTVGQNCQPLSEINGTRIYPCGLIANSLFNDTFSSAFRAVNGTSADKTVPLTDEGIAWATDSNRFQKTRYNYTEIVPPPNWYKKFPNGYNATNVPDISTWPQFQNWMRPAALATFNKLALRNDTATLEAGQYQIDIGLHFPVLPYNGKKYIYITQRSVIGGKNDFLGISWIVAGGICFVLGLTLLVINFVKPRKTGDVNLLSWNQEKTKRDEQSAAAAAAGYGDGSSTGFEK